MSHKSGIQEVEINYLRGACGCDSHEKFDISGKSEEITCELVEANKHLAVVWSLQENERI